MRPSLPNELPVWGFERDSAQYLVALGLSTRERAEALHHSLKDLAPRQALLQHKFPPPKIDGRLRDPAWRVAEMMCGFTQTEPKEGQAASEDTEVRIL